MPETCIVVTGASKGIGRAIAVELDRRGLAVVGLSRSGDSPVGEGRGCDMTDEAAVRNVLAAIAQVRPIAGLVNNAGLHIGSPSAALPTAEYEKVMALNATAVMVTSREAHPYLKETAGRIVNIGSFFDKLGVPDNLAYCNFLLNIGQGGTAVEIAVAMLPCAWIYCNIAEHLTKEHPPRADHPYQKWMALYADPEFLEVTNWLRAFVDRGVEQMTEAEQRRLEQVFRVAVDYEWLFWEMAWTQQSWPEDE